MSFAQNRGTNQPSLELRPLDRLTLGLIGMGVIFASLGAGEAVYRLAFFDFDGATDRLPIEMLFGLAFAWMTTKVVRKIYQHRMETSARINLIWDRNHKIRHAVEAIPPVPHPANHQRTIYRELIGQKTRVPEAWEGLGMLALRDRQTDEARKDFAAAMEAGAKSAECYMEYARLQPDN